MQGVSDDTGCRGLGSTVLRRDLRVACLPACLPAMKRAGAGSSARGVSDVAKCWKQVVRRYGRGWEMTAREAPPCGSGLVAGPVIFSPIGQRLGGMTCARRLAGAHRPAPSAGSPSRPEPRPWRRRARLSRLLPVLALLLGALSPFAAAPAAADVLVSNLGQARNTQPTTTAAVVIAQAFTTGTNTDGYTLTSIEAVIGASLNSAQRATVRAELWSESSGAPASKVADLEVPSTATTGTVAFTAPSNTPTLTASGTYYFVVYTVGNLHLQLSSTSSNGEDSSGQSSWSIANRLQYSAQDMPGAGMTWATEVAGVVLAIRVNGSAAGTSSSDLPTWAPAGSVWAATLTVKNIPGGFGVGCFTNSADSSVQCSNSAVLTETMLTVGGITNEVNRVTLLNGSLTFSYVGASNTAVSSNNFCVGSNSFSLATLSTFSITWTSTGLSWAAGDEVRLSIGPSCQAGTSSDPPAAPTNLDVTAGDTTLDLSWTAPSGTVTGYDVHYTSAAVADVTNSATASGNDASAAWVDAGHTGTTAADEITGLTNDTPYRVRVRAVNANGNSGWVFDTGTPAQQTVTAPSVPQSVQVTPGDSKLTLTWQAPASWGSQPLRAFGVQWKLSSADASHWAVARVGVLQDGSTSAEFTGSHQDAVLAPHQVTNGTSYDLRIRALSFKSDNTNELQSAWVEVLNKVPFVPATVTLSASPNPVGEGSPVTVTAHLSAPASGNVTIPVTLTDDDAESGDHGALTGIAIAGGATSGTAEIATNHDTDEDDELFTVALDTANLPTGYSAGSPSSVRIRIADDEGIPEVTLHVSRNPVTEGGATMVEARLKRGGRAYRPVGGTAHIRLLVRRGTLETGDVQSILTHDTLQTHSVPMPIYGSSWRGTFSTYQIKTVSDRDADDETFTVELGPLPSGYVRGDPSAVVITIKDTDTLRGLWLQHLRLQRP